MTASWRRRLRESVPTFILGAVIYIPLLLTHPGQVGADTKTYLYLDPSRLLRRAPSMWDPGIGMGTVTHQNIGYLWPMGPWYWLMQTIGVPDWVAQRLWLGSILFLAGVGVRYLMKALGHRGPHITAATFVYALTPYVLTLAARLSVILLPYAGLPWMLAFTVLALRRGGWRYPALFALTVATVGSVNATALLLGGVGPVLWILCEVVITREATWRRALATVARIGSLTLACSLWWIAGLWAQGGYGIEILRYTETAQTVATGSAAPEVLRSLGYWFFYGEDTYGPWIAPSKMYTQRLWLLFVTYLIPVLALVGAAIARFRERAFFALLVLTGTFLAVGGHPWDSPPPAGRVVKAFLLSDIGLSMRSLPRAVPLLALGLAVFLGAGIAALTAERPRLARPATAFAVALAIVALPPLWMGKLVDVNLQHPEAIPAYWLQAAAALDARGHGTRVLEVPGADFASYRWGTTVDPITPGLMDRPYVARELIPYGSPPSADLLNALDRQMQESVLDPAAIAPVARLMGVGDVNMRSDLTYERYNTPRPRLLWNLLSSAPGLGTPLGFGGTAPNRPRPTLPLLDETELGIPPSYPNPPQVAILPVRQPEAIVRTAPVARPVVLAGDGEGVVGAAAAGLLSGHELLLYSAAFAAHPDQLQAQLAQHAALILTDTNRRRARRWGTVRENTGATERAGQKPLRFDAKDQRLNVFPDAGDASATVAVGRGGAWAEATAYGNAVSLTPEDQPAYAIDGDPRTGVQEPGTAWRVGGFSSAVDEAIRVHYTKPVTTDQVRLVQVLGGVRNRFITEVRLKFDGGDDDVTVPLDPTSHEMPGQVVGFPKHTFRTLQITITKTDVGKRTRYDGISPVGFSEIDVQPGSPASPVGDDVVRLPTDLLQAAGTSSLQHELAIVLTRLRTLPSNAVRSDEERSIARTFALPTDRSFAISGQVRLANTASDDTIDRVLGLPDAAAGGVTATSGRRLPGGLENRASAAIDGDPTTWYSPGFLGQQGEHVTYEVGTPLSFDHMDLTVLDDGRHSVPQRIRIEADGQVAAAVDLPPIGDQRTPGAHHTFHLTLPKITGRKISVVVDRTDTSVREVKTIDYYTHQPIVMPVGIVELGIPGLHAPAPARAIDARCRTDLLTVNGRAVGLSLHGTTADLLAGKPIVATTCDGQPLRLPAGSTTLRTALGRDGGLDVDTLTLRSAPGGGADRGHGPLTPASVTTARPKVTILHSSRTAYDLRVDGSPRGSWLVLGQSLNLGWHATVGGKDLGPPTLVDGYANGWRLPAGSGPVRVRLEWTPQRVVWGSIVVSLLSVLVALVLVFRPRRSPAPAGDERVPLDARPSMPRAYRLARVMQYAGPRPGTFATAATVLGALVIGGAANSPLAGVALAVVTAVAMRVPQARPVLTIGSPAMLAISAAFVIAKQLVNRLPSGFDWPTYFEKVHQVAWAAVLLLVIDVVVDRCWLRRWWPTDDSPC